MSGLCTDFNFPQKDIIVNVLELFWHNSLQSLGVTVSATAISLKRHSDGVSAS